MPTPFIDYNNDVVQKIPQFHRTPKNIAWFQGMISQVSWLAKNFYNYCFGDSTSPIWSNAVVYGINDVAVVYSGTYISTISNNFGNKPDSTTVWISGTYAFGNVVSYLNQFYQVQVSSTSTTPDTTSDWSLVNFDTTTGTTTYGWYQISPSNIGAFERGQYNAQKLNMEYGLNRYFRTVFRNPTTILIHPAAGYSPRSDIFIDTIPIVSVSMVRFPTVLSPVSHRYRTHSDGSYRYPSPVYASATSYIFQINVPTALATALGIEYDSIIRNKVDKVNLVGITYKIIPYL